MSSRDSSHESLETLVKESLDEKLEILIARNSCSPTAGIRVRRRIAWVGHYIWLGLSILQFSCVAFFPILPHTTIVLEEHDHREILKYATKLMESLAPGCAETFSTMIPSDWSPDLTRYEFYHKGICRRKEGLERVCYTFKGKTLITGLIEDFGLQIAHDSGDETFFSNWSDAFSSAVREAKFEIRRGQSSEDAVKFITATHLDLRIFPRKVWNISTFVSFAIGVLWEALYYSGSAKDSLVAVGAMLILAQEVASTALALLSDELERHSEILTESLNCEVARGGFFMVVFLNIVWQFLHISLLAVIQELSDAEATNE